MKSHYIWSILLFTLLIGTAFVQAQPDFDASPSFLWLVEHCDHGNCGNSVVASAWYAHALKASGYPAYGQEAVDYIKSQEDTQLHCFPKGSCRIKDTVFALQIYDEYGEETGEIEAYIADALRSGLTENWWLEVITSAQDTSCKIQYPVDDALEETTIAVDQGTFPECNAGQPQTYFDLNSCIIPNLVNNNPALELKIDCSTIGPGTVISVIYNEGSSYYLTDQATTARYTSKLQNACHPEQKNGPCNKDTSLWANWILTSRQSDISTNLWLLTKYDRLNAVDSALIALATTDTQKRGKYIEDLIALQKLDGSFDKSALKTATAIMALEVGGSTDELNEAIAWLQDNRNNDFSWDGSVSTTAFVLYTAFAGANIELPPLGTRPPIDGSFDECGDGICQPSETSFSCAQDCETIAGSCTENGFCEPDFDEDSLTCPADCSCGDGVCDKEERRSGSCEDDCGSTSEPEVCGNDLREGAEECDGIDDVSCPGECSSFCSCPGPVPEKKSNFTWIIVTVVILLLLAAAILWYMKHGKRKPSTPSFSLGGARRFPPPRSPSKASRQYRAPPRGVAKQKTSKSERDLEKSLAEAKKLLKK